MYTKLSPLFKYLFVFAIVSQMTIKLTSSSTTMMTGRPPNTSTTVKCGTTAGTNLFTYTTVSDDANGSVTGYPGGYREITANGCPGYDWTSQTTPNTPYEQTIKIKLPLQPKLSTSTYTIAIKNPDGSANTTPPILAVGIAVNGVAIYGNSDANGLDAYINEAVSFDKCGGHPQQFGEYHYHSEPGKDCVFTDTSGQHSPLFGFMYDGIPIYGEYGDNGVAPTELDSCGGHVDKTYPYYHYHLPKEKAYPYTLTCLKGCIYSNNGNPSISTSAITTVSTCKMQATQYDYSSLLSSVKQSPKTTSTGASSISFDLLILMILYLFID